MLCLKEKLTKQNRIHIQPDTTICCDIDNEYTAYKIDGLMDKSTDKSIVLWKTKVQSLNQMEADWQ